MISPENHLPKTLFFEHRPDTELPYNAKEMAHQKRAFYNNFDLYSFRRRRNAFWERLRSGNFPNLVEEAANVISTDSRKNAAFLLAFAWKEFVPGTRLWRARQVSRDFLLPDTIRSSDLWEPPKELTGPGRFNTAGSPLLYACHAYPIDTLAEAQITKSGTYFLLVGFTVVHPLPMLIVGSSSEPALSPRQRQIEREVTEFVAQVISMNSNQFGEQTYTYTQQALERFFPISDTQLKGWIYRSTVIEPHLGSDIDPVNFAITPEAAHSHLTVSNVSIGELKGQDAGYRHINLIKYSSGALSDSNHLIFHDIPRRWTNSIEEYFEFLISQ